MMSGGQTAKKKTRSEAWEALELPAATSVWLPQIAIVNGHLLARPLFIPCPGPPLPPVCVLVFSTPFFVSCSLMFASHFCITQRVVACVRYL